MILLFLSSNLLYNLKSKHMQSIKWGPVLFPGLANKLQRGLFLLWLVKKFRSRV